MATAQVQAAARLTEEDKELLKQATNTGDAELIAEIIFGMQKVMRFIMKSIKRKRQRSKSAAAKLSRYQHSGRSEDQSVDDRVTDQYSSSSDSGETDREIKSEPESSEFTQEPCLSKLKLHINSEIQTPSLIKPSHSIDQTSKSNNITVMNRSGKRTVQISPKYQSFSSETQGGLEKSTASTDKPKSQMPVKAIQAAVQSPNVGYQMEVEKFPAEIILPARHVEQQVDSKRKTKTNRRATKRKEPATKNEANSTDSELAKKDKRSADVVAEERPLFQAVRLESIWTPNNPNIDFSQLQVLNTDTGHVETMMVDENRSLAVPAGDCIQNWNPTNKHICTECNYEAESAKQLKKHNSEIHTNTTCHIDGCNFKAKNMRDLKRHQTKAHPDYKELYPCDKCEYKSEKRTNLRQHMLIHLAPEEKPFKCPYENCGYASANKEGLIIHDNTRHKGMKPFMCDACGMCFSGYSMLSKHKLMKHKPKHLKCNYPHCNYTTSLQNWLKDHMRVHSAETPYICLHCSYTAKSAGRLKVHMRTHTGEKPYQCHICEYASAEACPLKKHLAKQHDLKVSKIDVRAGMLYLMNGDTIKTGKGTTTAPLPENTYQPGTVKTPHNMRNSRTKTDSSIAGPQTVFVETAPMDDFPTGAEVTIVDASSIIAQAATLSALPVDKSPAASPERSDMDTQTIVYTVRSDTSMVR